MEHYISTLAGFLMEIRNKPRPAQELDPAPETDDEEFAQAILDVTADYEKKVDIEAILGRLMVDDPDIAEWLDEQDDDNRLYHLLQNLHLEGENS